LKKVAKEFITSIITVILAIFAIAIFISSGAGLLFYAAVAIAMIFGFYNAWLISVLDIGTKERTPKSLKYKNR
jgi:preprotein translocase subunit SecF